MLTGLQIKFSHAEHSRRVKFIRAWWFFVYYIQSWIFAYCIVQKELWMWDTSLWWYNYPYQVVTTPCWMYYMTSMAFSWSVIVFEIKKMPPDLSPTLLSHLCIILYMSLSWLNGFYRVTIALVFVEDFSNLLKEATRLIKYCNYRIVYRMLLTVYIVVWTCTHLVFFQFWVLSSVYTESPETLKDSPLYYIYSPLFICMLAVRYYTVLLLLRGLFQ
ncbi:ceramide synthase 6-like [Schistocerca cancellata]|uniref:ceramide synthase 6-like n=1 Tax=Schistocerca cancellata TaxID=274614 RepID=UPI00211778B9|nr:ceramide synthase 6-like [Schistocerca cancellata]